MPSNYGQGWYGQELYSQSSVWNFVGNLTPAVSLGGAFVATNGLAGNLAPVVTFGPSQLTTPQNIAGGLAPTVTFAANMSLIYSVRGDLAPQTALGASLTGVWDLAGNMAPGVVLAASAVLGPLWGASEPCPPPEWGETAPCPPSMWTPVVPPPWQIQGFSTAYGMGPYGVSVYNQPSEDPWYAAELCDG
jgi:hypothetical protein